ncbi:MAG: Anthranilate synthase, amidotransferase component @ Para-aminobenzoate synthase, amidotransferase component [uncultured Thermomicrobiales bacterium]|uniref:Anthranilate synthase, amidotransferase component @ Para-aminobenzoate synthase, amidotransferase component n=1 Tax=uncultured Thermomicrobiales bacterium TaxID=1645740 RepID=A0A6J4VIC8_9BACT|nr:MAG: Anthranilate synthase, amidotransferase component @ Para-aminobenzoate synthase, amidotransferase component [uncultured Thermomicrobiales bacterium]
MILLLDNYDSFTFNLYQAMAGLGAEVEVVRNDRISVAEIEARIDEIDGIVVSPGPCTPTEAGISVSLVERLAGRRPILGVCLGHQSIGAAFGAEIVHAPELRHGKTSMVTHDGRGVYEGLPNPFVATRYHSLIVDRSSIPDSFEITAESEDGVVMGVRHRSMQIEGVQFHPESILTTSGADLLANFLRSCGAIPTEREMARVVGY